MLKNILVAINGSDPAERVINALQDLHLDPEAKICLAHVVDSFNSSPDIASDRPPAEIEKLPDLYLGKLNDYQSQLPYPSELEIVRGDPAEEIIRLAHIHHADLIIMGSRGLKGLNRVLQGSVSSQVVADAPCSVLVIRTTHHICE